MRQVKRIFYLVVLLTIFGIIQSNGAVLSLDDKITIISRPVTILPDGEMLFVSVDHNSAQIEITLSCLINVTSSIEIYLQKDNIATMVDILDITNQTALIDVSGLALGQYDIYVKSGTEIILIGIIEIL